MSRFSMITAQNCDLAAIWAAMDENQDSGIPATVVCLAAERKAALSLRVPDRMKIATGSVLVWSARLGGVKPRTICWPFLSP